MKKIGKSIFIVSHGGYPFDVMVAIGATDGEVLAALRERGVEPTEEEKRDGLNVEGEITTEGRVMMLRGGQTILRLRSFDGTAKHWGQLSHEIFHAVDTLLFKIGVRHTESSCEAYAYAIQHLTSVIVHELAKPANKRARSLLAEPKLRRIRTARRGATVKRRAVAKAAKAARRSKL